MNATDLAAELRAAYDEGFAAAITVPTKYYADTVETAHVPPNPNDGPKPAGEMREGAVTEANTLLGVMPDIRLDATIDTDGDRVVIKAVQRGTLPDGSAFEMDLGLDYELADGKIVRTTATYDPLALGPLMPALMAAFPDLAQGQPGQSG